jgi:hypothetical protein
MKNANLYKNTVIYLKRNGKKNYGAIIRRNYIAWREYICQI